MTVPYPTSAEQCPTLGDEIPVTYSMHILIDEAVLLPTGTRHLAAIVPAIPQNSTVGVLQGSGCKCGSLKASNTAS